MTQMPTYRWMNKLTMMYPYNGILLSNEKELDYLMSRIWINLKIIMQNKNFMVSFI